MKTVTLDQFREELKAQGVPVEHFAFICPMCEAIQSATDLINAGAGDSFESVEKYLGFSCFGRFTGAGSPKKGEGPCNWTLGGLFQTHKYEVVTDDGEKHPRFSPASAEEAQEHMKANLEKAA